MQHWVRQHVASFLINSKTRYGVVTKTRYGVARKSCKLTRVQASIACVLGLVTCQLNQNNMAASAGPGEGGGGGGDSHT